MANMDGNSRTTKPCGDSTFPARGVGETTERVREAGEKRGGARNGSGSGHGAEETGGVEGIAIPDYVMRDFGPPNTREGGSR